MSLQIIDYTEKSIALFGDTKPYKTKIAEIGGKFNAMLKYKNTDERKPGWIFPASKRSDVEKLVKEVGSGTIQPEEVTEYKKSEYKQSETSISKKDFMNLVSKIERLEQEIVSLKSVVNISSSSSSSFKSNKIISKVIEHEESEEPGSSSLSSEEEESKKPSNRLMRKK